MSRAAKVDSVDTLKQFRAALCSFAEIASGSLDEAAFDIQRTLIWLKQEQSAYWKAELRARSERYAEARRALKRRELLDKPSMGGNYSFVDEKKALALAERRLEEAQRKLESVRHWVGRLEKESFDYKGTVQGLVSAVEVEIPNARARLDGMIDALEAYGSLAPPGGEESMSGSGDLQSAARAGDVGDEAVTADKDVDDAEGQQDDEPQPEEKQSDDPDRDDRQSGPVERQSGQVS